MAEIIAETCQNHNGDPKLLKDMVEAAADAGAAYVKYQDFRSADLTRRERFEQGLEEGGQVRILKRPHEEERSRLGQLDLPDEVIPRFVEACHGAGVKAMVTISNYGRIPFHTELGWDALKVASPDCSSLPFLTELAKHFRPMYVSTGGTEWPDIHRTAERLADDDLTLLHCVTIYPTPLDRLNLRRMETLRTVADRVGFSDHSLVSRDGLTAAKTALALGADVVERHFSLLEPDQTRDGVVSINADQLRELCDFAAWPDDRKRQWLDAEVSDLDVMLGSAEIVISAQEKVLMDFYRGRFAHKMGDRTVYNWEPLD